MQVELRRIHREIGGTFVFVTHDQGEALGLANRIAVMDQGELVQVGDAEEIYMRPKTRFVSTFIGEANVLSGERRQGVVTLRAGPKFQAQGPDGPVTLVLRPETLRLGPPGTAQELAVSGRMDDIVFLGAFAKYRIVLESGETLAVHSAEPRLRRELAIGAPVSIGWASEDQHVLGD
jgi:ABC-type Fe3+/spermidine/putrescine transport system ATPase subunit